MGASTCIFQTIDRTPSIDSEDKKGKALSYVRGEIDFQDIHSSYPSRPDTPILQGLNLRIPVSKTVGLVGGSGSRKSTAFDGRVNIPKATFPSAFDTAYDVIAEAGSMNNDLSKGGNGIGSVFAILDRKSEIDPNQMIFKGLNLKIDAEKTMALAGPSGSGKATIFGLIERFYDPMKQAVFIDRQDIKSFNLRILRSHIALVSQEPTLFAGTIRENIACGKEDARESEIRKAAVDHGMKDGYDTSCGERGVQLSGGQKQRIALARAILKDPSILLLDEATSALDSVSESLVEEDDGWQNMLRLSRMERS
ncbi:hypothetical protein POTOM_039998 [Populus tomentosa]|uniref:ABC transporter domain-containing protein n=1 Tax=Populus tomentosa TaxID=118781 RepID=A0A8X7YVP9_POPTO|nr:hypothetical protein POTOM_039998 [Populus tomentosa]